MQLHDSSDRGRPALSSRDGRGGLELDGKGCQAAGPRSLPPMTTRRERRPLQGVPVALDRGRLGPPPRAVRGAVDNKLGRSKSELRR